MSWTDERIERLKTMWEKGMTASQIAEELGGVSRNAVIGKAHRLDLKSRPSPVKGGDAKAATKAPATKGKSKAAAPAPAKTGKATAAAPAPASKATAPAARKGAAAAPAPRTSTDTASEAESAPVLAAGTQPMPPRADAPKIVSIGPGGFIRQGPGEQQAPIPPAPPRRLVPAKPSAEIADKTSLLDLNDRICRWPMGHPGEPDFHFCGQSVNPGFPYCVEHCGRAFQAQLPRGTRRAPPPMPFGGPRVR